MYLSSYCLRAAGWFEVFFVFFVSERSRLYANTEKEKDRIGSLETRLQSMKRLLPYCIGILLAFALSGCRTSYQEAVAARQDVMFGTGDFARERATKMANSTVNRKLGALELGRLKMLQGDFSGSSAVLGPQLEELFDETNEGPS